MAELQGLGAHLSEAEKAGVEIVAVSPDPNERSQKLAEGLRLGYRFLADRDLAVTRRYGLVHAGAGPNGQDVPRPTTRVGAPLRARRLGRGRFRRLEVDVRQERRRDQLGSQDLSQFRRAADGAVLGAMTNDGVTRGLMNAREFQQLLRIREVDPGHHFLTRSASPSAHARATSESAFSCPGILSQPPFSMYSPLDQLLTSANSLSFWS